MVSLYLSFDNLGETWDSEFPTTNINHLADPFFVLSKRGYDLNYGSLRGKAIRYTSPTLQNEGGLIWNLINDDIYINTNKFFIAVLDDDNNGFIEDIMLGPPSEREIPFVNLNGTQPTTATFQEAAINLEYQMDLEW